MTRSAATTIAELVGLTLLLASIVHVAAATSVLAGCVAWAGCALMGVGFLVGNE